MKFLIVLVAIAYYGNAKPMMKTLPNEEAVAEPALPSFLIDAPEDVVESFFEMIERAGNMKDDEINDAVEKWVGEQSTDLKSKFAEFKKDRELRAAIMASEHQKATENFSPEARLADVQIRAIASHPEMTAKTKDFLIQEYLRTLSPEVRKELEPLMMVF